MRASHILVKDRALAERVYAEAKSGKDFAALARKYSTCPSKEKGGDLGWFSSGQMVKEFENATLKLGCGQISKPVRSQFGYHIIKKTGYKE